MPQGDQVISNLNKYIEHFLKTKLPVFASRDWHPKKTKHFKKFGGIWPVHCVQNTKGAGFHPKLNLPEEAIIISKGMDPKKDSYTAFDSTDSNGKPFITLLKTMGINELYIGGLATDYCVKFTCLDALKNGFKVNLLTDAVKGVDLKPSDSKDAILELLKSGAKKYKLKEIKNRQ